MNLYRYIITSILILIIEINTTNTQEPPDIHKFPPLPDRYFSNILKTKPRLYAIKDVNIVPMNMETVLKGSTVLIKDGKIQDIGLTNHIIIPDNYEIIDGTGKYLMPGLTDMHVHFYQENDLILFLANGVTTVRNMQGEQNHLRMRDKINRGIIFGPTIFTTTPYLKIDDISQVETVVADFKKSGYDFLKIRGYLNYPIYKEIMNQSRKYGIKAVGHLPFNGSLKAVIEEKQYTIEHLMSLISNELGAKDSIDSKNNNYEKLQKVAQSGTWLCITHSPISSRINTKSKEEILRNSQYRYIHPIVFLTWFGNTFKDFIYYDLVKEYTKKFFDLQGKIILGTDCGMPYIMPGFSVHEQLKTFVNAGLTPYQALKTATFNSADCLGILVKSGTVDVGKNADLVLLNGNPLENIDNTRKIEGVLLKGVWFPKNELQEMLDNVTNYYRDDIIPMFTKNALLPNEVRNIYFGEYKIDVKSNFKSRVVFGTIVLVLLTSVIFTVWKIKHNQ